MILSNPVVVKYKDPRSPTISCNTDSIVIDRTLLDLSKFNLATLLSLSTVSVWRVEANQDYVGACASWSLSFQLISSFLRLNLHYHILVI